MRVAKEWHDPRGKGRQAQIERPEKPGLIGLIISRLFLSRRPRVSAQGAPQIKSGSKPGVISHHRRLERALKKLDKR